MAARRCHFHRSLGEFLAFYLAEVDQRAGDAVPGAGQEGLDFPGCRLRVLLEDQRDDYIAEWSRLQLEQAWLADASHVENEARERLRMQTPPEARILVIKP